MTLGEATRLGERKEAVAIDKGEAHSILYYVCQSQPTAASVEEKELGHATWR